MKETIKKSAAPKGAPSNADKSDNYTSPLAKTNFFIMLVAVALVVIGFAITGSGEPNTEAAWNADIFSTLRIAVGPTIAFLGFVLMFFGILYQKK